MQPNRRKPLPPLLQNLIKSALMAGFVLFSFSVAYRYLNELAAASLAASAFIALCFSKSDAARPRALVGGYACGVFAGIACNLAMMLFDARAGEYLLSRITFCSLAVFFTCFLMLSLRFMHPPAAALSISMVIEPSPYVMGLIVMVCILVLCALQWAAHKLLDGYVLPPGHKPPAQPAPPPEPNAK